MTMGMLISGFKVRGTVKYDHIPRAVTRAINKAGKRMFLKNLA
jgi:hypothetical protein